MTDLIQTIQIAAKSAKDAAAKLFSQSHLAKLRPQPQEHVDPEKACVAAFNHFQERLLANQNDRTAVILGESLKRASQYLVEDYQQAKIKDANLTPEKFLLDRSPANKHKMMVAGYGYELSDHHEKKGPASNQTMTYIDLTANDYPDILDSIKKVWAEDHKHDIELDASATLTHNGEMKHHVQVRGISRPVKFPGEEAADIYIRARTEGEYPQLTGGKFGIVGMMAVIPMETCAAYLKSLPQSPR